MFNFIIMKRIDEFFKIINHIFKYIKFCLFLFFKLLIFMFLFWIGDYLSYLNVVFWIFGVIFLNTKSGIKNFSACCFYIGFRITLNKIEHFFGQKIKVYHIVYRNVCALMYSLSGRKEYVGFICHPTVFRFVDVHSL